MGASQTVLSYWYRVDSPKMTRTRSFPAPLPLHRGRGTRNQWSCHFTASRLYRLTHEPEAGEAMSRVLERVPASGARLWLASVVAGVLAGAGAGFFAALYIRCRPRGATIYVLYGLFLGHVPYPQGLGAECG